MNDRTFWCIDCGDVRVSGPTSLCIECAIDRAVDASEPDIEIEIEDATAEEERHAAHGA